MTQALLLKQYKGIIVKLTERLSVIEGEDKLLNESLEEAGLTEDEIAVVNEMCVSEDEEDDDAN